MIGGCVCDAHTAPSCILFEWGQKDREPARLLCFCALSLALLVTWYGICGASAWWECTHRGGAQATHRGGAQAMHVTAGMSGRGLCCAGLPLQPQQTDQVTRGHIHTSWHWAAQLVVVGPTMLLLLGYMGQAHM